MLDPLLQNYIAAPLSHIIFIQSALTINIIHAWCVYIPPLTQFLVLLPCSPCYSGLLLFMLARIPLCIGKVEDCVVGGLAVEQALLIIHDCYR